MTQQKKTIRYCKNHPKKISSSTCSVCKSEICTECLLVYKEKHFCTASCIPEELKNCILNCIPQKKEKKTICASALITWSACTLTLCALVFTTWIFRELNTLKFENEALQINRNVLLSRLQYSNTDSNMIQDKTKSIDTLEILNASVKKSAKNDKKNQIIPQMTVFRPLEKITNTTFSFDNGSIDNPLISLTFDGGSIANAAIEILDTLRSRDVRTTMFLTGRFIKNFPDVVSLICSDNHEVGNHTYTHPHLTSYEQNRIHSTLPKITQELIHKELKSTDNCFFSITGHHMSPLWRAPYGEFNGEICGWARNAGYYHIGWRRGKGWTQNLDSNDWISDSETPGYKSPDDVLLKILSLAKTKPYGINGGIILMHLGTIRKNRVDQVHLKIGVLIDSLRSLGYTLVPVSEMMRLSGHDEILTQLASKIININLTINKNEE